MMEYYKFLKQYVGQQPIILPGSVVIILNPSNELLLQKRYEGLPKLDESFEDTQLLGDFSGPDCYLKVSNGDELYAVTAVQEMSSVI